MVGLSLGSPVYRHVGEGESGAGIRALGRLLMYDATMQWQQGLILVGLFHRTLSALALYPSGSPSTSS